MKIKFLDLKKQYVSMKEEIQESIKNVIEDTAFIGGKYVESFENHFAKYQESEFCIGVGNGTDALEIALWSLDLPSGSEVIVPANSFIATSEAVSRNRLKVVFADCSDDYTISVTSIRKLINSNTSCIIPVHLYGQPCDMDEIVLIAQEHNLKIIEDCAQAHGAMYKNKKIGTFGSLSTFSFYPGKNLGAYGDAGAIITNDKDLEKRCRMYSNHGRSTKFFHQIEGRNSRLDGIQAAILDVKLKYLDRWIEKRNILANYYLDELKGLPIILPLVQNNICHVWHLFVIKVEEREKLKNYLEKNKIQTGIHYPIALPKLKAYNDLKGYTDTYKACNDDNKLLSLPISEQLTKEEIFYIVTKIKEYYYDI